MANKCVLISIQPPHTTNIFDEIKCVEWRTKPIPTGKQYVFETKNGGGIGLVIGECLIWRVKRYENLSMIPEFIIEGGCVPYEFLQKYSKGKPLYAHFIVGAKRYDEPKALSKFKSYNCSVEWEDGYPIPTHEIKRPPQSWCYVEELNDGTAQV